MSERRKQIHLAAHFPGVNNTTVWSDPTSGSQTDFASFVHLAQTAERGKFDFFFLAEGLRLREHRGEIFDLDVVGRPDSLTVLAALSAVTARIGLAATLNTTFNEPFELARQFATLDHLSGGRAAWNAVTSPDAFTGENFRRGGFLERGDRYTRAEEFIALARVLWDTWADDAVSSAGSDLVAPDAVDEFVHVGTEFDIRGRFDVPRSPQGHAVIIQAGDSDGGRELAARQADVIFSRHSGYRDGQAFYEDVKGRLAQYGRQRDDLKIIPAATAVVGDTDDDARELHAHIRRQQVSPQGALAFVEQVWNRDLSSYDPDGPLPDIDPDTDTEHTITRGRVRHDADPRAVAARWRERAERDGLSIRQLVIEMTTRSAFVGSAATVAATIDEYVQADAADGYILVPHLTPHGLDRFVDEVVPILQERGVFRHDYDGPTLRDHLGLARPARSVAERRVAVGEG